MATNLIKETGKAAEELINLLGIKGNTSVEEDKENDALRVQVDAEEAGVLIGHHGETIDAFQFLLAQIVRQRTGEAKRLLVNVGDWREKREETLRNLAQNAADKVRQSGEPYHIYDLSPAERRVVHIELTEEKDIVTESEGEGRERHLVVKPKT